MSEQAAGVQSQVTWPLMNTTHWPLAYGTVVFTTRPALVRLKKNKKNKKTKTSCHDGGKHKLSRSLTLPSHTHTHTQSPTILQCIDLHTDTHTFTRWCRYTELVKPLHTVCYSWFRNGVKSTVLTVMRSQLQAPFLHLNKCAFWFE